jgi:hypothetical protein
MKMKYMSQQQKSDIAAQEEYFVREIPAVLKPTPISNFPQT